MPANDPRTREPHRFSIRLPHWGWFVLGTVVLVIGFVSLSLWLPYHRELQVLQKIEAWGGAAETRTFAPEWLKRFVGEDRLKELKVCDRIDVVSLSSTAIIDADVADLSGLTNLQGIALDYTTVTDAGLVHLSRLKNLKALSLECTTVTDEGLAHLSGLTKLAGVVLDKTQVTDAGLVHLSGLTSLKMVSLENTRVTDDGLVHLKKLGGLAELRLGGTHVTDAGVADLQLAFPGLKIEQ